MPTVPRDKYPEMNWRAADKVAAWKLFKQQMKVIFMADQVPEERQWALILVAGSDEAYNRWDTLVDTVEDRRKVDQVWDAFEKSFEQSTSFWHFRDAYLADFRQEESETTADLDLCIKQTVRGCQWKKETEEGRMIDLLYHATIYYEICKFVQESEPAALTYEMVIEKAKAHERNILEYKDHQASHGGANSAPSHNNPLLSTHALSKRRPSGRGNNGQRCCRGITRIHRLPSRPSHPYGRQPHSLIFMSTLYKASSRLPAKQLTNDHEPACMCHLYRLRINTHVLTITMPCFMARHGGSAD